MAQRIVDLVAEMNKYLEIDKDTTLMDMMVNEHLAWKLARTNWQQHSKQVRITPTEQAVGSYSRARDLRVLLFACHELYMPQVNENRTGVSIFMTPQKMLAGIRTPMKFTKYLKLVGVIDNEDVKAINDIFRTNYCASADDIKWANGIEISDIYQECGHDEEGASSCMSYGSDYWGMPDDKHPTMAYDSKDVSLAYLKTKGGRIKARTLINNINKSYVRVYGDRLLGELLREQGYTQGDLQGCRLKKVPVDSDRHGSGYCMPYIDGDAFYVNDMGDYFEAVNSGDIDTNSDGFHSIGMVGEDGYTARRMCEYCDEYVGEDEITYSEWHEIGVCNSCVSTDFVTAYSGLHHQDLINVNDGVVWEYEGEWYTSEGATEHDLYLIDDELYDTDDLLYDDLDEEYYPQDRGFVAILYNGNRGVTLEENVSGWFAYEDHRGNKMYAEDWEESIYVDGTTYDNPDWEEEYEESA